MKLLHHPIFQVTPGARLTPERGLRTAVALALALLVLALIGHTPFGGAVGLGILLGVVFTSFCDLSVAGQARLVAMSALTLGGPFVVAVGRSLSTLWWSAALEVFVVTLLAGSLLARGPLPRLVGLMLTIVFVVSLGIDGGPGTALPSALGFLCGGAVVLLLALVSSLPHRLHQHTTQPEGLGTALSRLHATLPTSLDVRSLLSRPALLRALGAGGAAALAWQLGVPYPQWAPITVLVCIQPDQKTSVLFAVQNSVGTLLGVMLADLLIKSTSNRLVVVLILMVVVFIAFTVKDLNYLLFTFFMTNLTLLLIHLASPGVSHARLRLFSVLVGVGIALAIVCLDQWLEAHQPPLAKPTS